MKEQTKNCILPHTRWKFSRPKKFSRMGIQPKLHQEKIYTGFTIFLALVKFRVLKISSTMRIDTIMFCRIASTVRRGITGLRNLQNKRKNHTVPHYTHTTSKPSVAPSPISSPTYPSPSPPQTITTPPPALQAHLLPNAILHEVGLQHA